MTKLIITLTTAAGLMLGLWGCDGTVAPEEIEPHFLVDELGAIVARYDAVEDRYLFEQGKVSVPAQYLRPALEGRLTVVPADEQDRVNGQPPPPQEDGSKKSGRPGEANGQGAKLEDGSQNPGGKLLPLPPNEGFEPGTPGNPPLEQCPQGLTMCDERCVDLGSDPDNCGACGTSCSIPTCIAGRCVSEPNVPATPPWTTD